MKRIILFLTLFCLIALCSCSGNGPPPEGQPPELGTVDISKALVSESDYPVWDKAYAPVIDCWRTAIGENFGCDLVDERHNDYPYFADFNVTDWLTADTFYAYYDIDANGTPELLTAGCEREEDWYYLFEIYALDGGSPVRLLAPLYGKGFDRELGLAHIYPDKGVINYPIIKEDGFMRLEVFCDIAPNGYEARFIEAFDTWDSSEWIYYPGSLSKDNALSISKEEGTELRKKYTSGTSYSKLLSMLVWRELAPSAVSKDAADYLEGYEPLSGTPSEYADVIESARIWLTVDKNVIDRGYNGQIIYDLLYSADTIRYDSVGIYPGYGLTEMTGECECDETGYAVYDINGDGINELIVMYKQDDGHAEVMDIFSAPEGQPLHLLDFRARGRCYGITPDGRIFCFASGGAGYNVLYCYTIDPGGQTLSVKAAGERYETNDRVKYSYGEKTGCAPDELRDWDGLESGFDEEAQKLFDSIPPGAYNENSGYGDDIPFAEFVPFFP